jgi:uncharacterized membrane protein
LAFDVIKPRQRSLQSGEFPMSLAPLLEAAPAIPVHAFAAMAAFALGLVQFAAPKGTLPHRTLGWIWVALMATVAASSFWIHQIRLLGPWSPIHLLSIFTLIVRRSHAPQGRRSPPDHDDDFCRRTGHCRPIHIPTGPDHARGGFRPIGGCRKRCFSAVLQGPKMPIPGSRPGRTGDPVSP